MKCPHCESSLTIDSTHELSAFFVKRYRSCVACQKPQVSYEFLNLEDEKGMMLAAYNLDALDEVARSLSAAERKLHRAAASLLSLESLLRAMRSASHD